MNHRYSIAATAGITMLVLAGCGGSAEPVNQGAERITETVTEVTTETATEVVTERPTSQLNSLRRRLRQRDRTISRLRDRIKNLRSQAVAESDNDSAAAAAPKSKPKPEPASGCHPSYQPCVPADVEDVDCAGGSGNGPEYTGRVTVVGPDEYGLDSDGDGVGCEN